MGNVIPAIRENHPMPDHQTKAPDAASADGDMLAELRQQVKDGRISAAGAWHAIEAVATAGLFPVIDRTHTDSLEVVIGDDKVWINESPVTVARWHGIKSLSVRDIRTPAAA
jgi:hypothetical protein